VRNIDAACRRGPFSIRHSSFVMNAYRRRDPIAGIPLAIARITKPCVPADEVARAQSQRRRRGIFVVVKHQPTKRRQARHLRKPHPEYAAPPELGNSPLAAATMMPRPRRSHRLPLVPYTASAKYSRKRQTSRVLRKAGGFPIGLSESCQGT
jgi:hypothetical protein